MDTEVIRQREYYARTASHYDEMHVRSDDEHGLAISTFAGLAHGTASVLDVGAGTGRALDILRDRLGDIRLVGVEPVRELREVGHQRGISPDDLIYGDAYALPFADNEFDFVIETGVLHHLATPQKAVAEMARVARVGVMISDSNKFGQGSALSRGLKRLVRKLGLWNLMIWAQTRGKMSKWSEGDGVYFSYSVFDNTDTLKQKFPRLFFMNTQPMTGTDLRAGVGHIMVIALK